MSCQECLKRLHKSKAMDFKILDPLVILEQPTPKIIKDYQDLRILFDNYIASLVDLVATHDVADTQYTRNVIFYEAK